MKRSFFFIGVILIFFAFTARPKKVYVIGDSISIQYGPFLKEYLAGSFEYDRLKGDEVALRDLNQGTGSNGGPSRRVVSLLDAFEKDAAFSPDVLLLNCGLHDIKTDTLTNKRQVDPEEYRKNLEKIYAFSKKKKIQLIWVRTTPVNDSIHKSKSKEFFRYNKDVILYNSIADEVFSKHKVPVIDLYTFTAKFGASAYIDHVHYVNDIRKLQASYIAGFLSALK